MAAPEGNSFWKQRSKHGRDKIFSSPEILWEAAQEYFTWCEENPLLETDWVGKDAIQVSKPKLRAFTWHGLEIFLDVTDDTLRNYKTKPEYKDFFGVLSRVERIIYNQKFTGAAAGFLNPNLISRDLGLTEKTQNETNVRIGVDLENEKPKYVD